MLLYALEFVSSQLLSGFGYFMLNACNMIAFAIVDNMPLGHNTHLYWLQRNIHRIQRVNEKRNQEYNTLISFLLKMAMSGKDSSSRGSNGKKKKN